MPQLKEVMKEADAASAKNNIRIAHLGSGLSLLGVELAKAFEHANILNIDSSEMAVKKLEKFVRSHYSKEVSNRCSYMCDDLISTKLACESFELCVDKGTYDAISRGGKTMEQAYLKEVNRILVPGGLFAQISNEPPEMVSFSRGSLWSRYHHVSIDAPSCNRFDGAEYW
eukprot:CAMPEP_0184024300 /NCGR_PEP_ID=MMETSP0954-20121128/11989_1 /TAXON_ID=627963 /ORGANISM="Aplanochytrium sp, Strain PBS07" /LENGTH=169 /DNA_ID=CAMNT_0026307579 /DNA_START=268 /DNA_END=774 /DNA_ORIENTATION=+